MQMEVSGNNNQKNALSLCMYKHCLVTQILLRKALLFVCFYFTLKLVVKWVQQA